MMFEIVTGGAGFIGSHLVDALVGRGSRVTVIDSLAAGSRKNLARHLDGGTVSLVVADLLDDGWQHTFRGVSRVWHLAADPDVRQSSLDPECPVSNNITATFRLLEAMRDHHIPDIVFTSTSTVYGEAVVIPTPEEYTPLEPISVYGATKLACEALISAYCHSFSMRSWIFRFANIIGSRSGHGVIPDFIKKLEDNPHELPILGDGNQKKSYLEVQDCVDAMLFATDHSGAAVNTFNIGSEDWIDVKTIAGIVAQEMGLSNVRYSFTGGERGWIGDVPRMQLSIARMKTLGWRPRHGSKQSVHMAVAAMLADRNQG